MARKRRKKKSQATDTTQTAAETVEESGEFTPEESEETEASSHGEEQTTEDVSTETPETETGEEATSDDGDLQKQLDEMKDKYIRARADMDNFRKRKVKELDEARRNSKLTAIEEIMPVMDQFQMAISAIDGAGDLETIKMGMKMIQTTFDRAFENLGVETISCVGETFDPNIHEAVSVEPSEDVPVDHVIREWKAGYRLGEFLIRPATVVVSSGLDSDDESEIPDINNDDSDNDSEQATD